MFAMFLYLITQCVQEQFVSVVSVFEMHLQTVRLLFLVCRACTGSVTRCI